MRIRLLLLHNVANQVTFLPGPNTALKWNPTPRPWGLTPSPTAPRAHGPPASTSTWPFLCPENYSCWLPPTCRPPGPPLALGQVLTLNRPVPLLTRALGSWGIKVRLESPVPGAAPGTYTLAESTNGDRGMESGKTSLRGRRGTGERLTQLSPQPRLQYAKRDVAPGLRGSPTTSLPLS